MSRRIFMRNADARGFLDIFFVSAVSSILLVRFYLHLTGYPTIGGAKYHIAHMLWGGLLMVAGFVINFAYLGSRLHKFVALLGGVGFGIFIDEVGKFITRDNNYFFRPAVGIIYAIFVVLYIAVTVLTREKKLSAAEYQMNALRSLEEAIMKDMDAQERADVRRYLEQTPRDDPITRAIEDLVHYLPLTRDKRRIGLWTRYKQWYLRTYEKFWDAQGSSWRFRLFFILETSAYVIAAVLAVAGNLEDVRNFLLGKADYGHSLVIGQFGATVIAAIFVMIGLVRLVSSRLEGLEWLRRATLVNLLLTQFFIFSRIEFAALPGFALSVLLLLAISAAMSAEKSIAATRHISEVEQT